MLQRLHHVELLQCQATKSIHLVTVAVNLVGNQVVVELAQIWLLLELRSILWQWILTGSPVYGCYDVG